MPNPICTPARAAIFTGQDNWTNGVYYFGLPINDDSPLWPKLLADAGYDTFFTGKWHNDGRPEDRGFTRAANMWLGGKYDHAALPVVQQGQPKNKRRPLDSFASTAFINAAIEFLNERQEENRTNPFCLFVSFTAPHDPWTPPGDYATMYVPEKIPLPPNFAPRPSFKHDDSFPDLRDQRQVPFPRTKEDVRAALSLYYGMITQMDHQIGRLLDKLDKAKLSNNTLVIFVGDHGYSLGSHGFVGKQCMYDEGIRTPLLVRYPKWNRVGDTSDALVNLIDLFPTIFDAAGMEVPLSVEGESLSSLYRGKTKPAEFRSEIFAAFHSPDRHRMSTRCVRTRQHKYVQHLLTGEEFLFDVQQDPHELSNLIDSRSLAGLRKQLADKLNAWGKDTPQAELKSR